MNAVDPPTSYAPAGGAGADLSDLLADLPFSDSDVRFCQVVASLTAKALRNAHRFDAMVRATQDSSQAQRRTELQRIALISFVRRLLDRYAKTEEHL